MVSARSICVLAAASALCGYLILPLGSASRPLLVWNVTASAPVGLYRVVSGRALARGDLVLAVPAPALAAFANARGYLPAHVPLVKRIAALAGDTVCTQGSAIVIAGRFVSTRLAADGKARRLPAWSGCRTLRPGEVFLLMAKVRDSFDGRYFGPTRASQIVGTLEPLWTP
jgi:conjugative transfer signal peptidase TraF